MNSLLLAVALFGAQESALDKRVDFDAVAAPLPRIVESLSARIGHPLRTTPHFEKDIVVVHLKDVRVGDALDRLALTVAGRWEELSDGTRVLAPNDAARNAESAAELRDRRNQIRKALDELGNPEQPSTNQNAVFFGMGSPSKPFASAVSKIAGMLDANELAGLGTTGRIVFSTTPNRMQRQLPAAALPIVRQFITSHNVEAQKRIKDEEDRAQREGAKTDEQRQAEAMSRQWVEALGMGGYDNRVVPADFARVLVIAQSTVGFAAMTGMGDNVDIEVRIYDGEGRVAFRGRQSLRTQDLTALMRIGEPQPQQQVEAEDTEIEFSPTTKELQSLSPSAFDPNTDWNRQISAELRQKLLRPDLHDPLSFAHSESAIFTAKQKDLDLIAVLPDTIAGGIQQFVTTSTATVQSTLKSLNEGSETEGTIEDGWWIVRPKRPAEARTRRLDRAALAAFLQTASQKTVPSIDDLAALAARIDRPTTVPVATRYFMMFTPNVLNQGMSGPLDWNLLRFYGRLAPSQRQQLRDGQRLQLGSLSTNVIEPVRFMAFGPEFRLAIRRREERQSPWQEMMSRFMPPAQREIRDEPTEALPNGIPPIAVVELSIQQERFIVPANGTSTTRMLGALGTEEIAWLRYMSQDARFSRMTSMLPRLDQVRVGTREVMNFRFLLTPQISIESTVNNDKLDAGSPIVSIDELPSDWLARIDRRQQALARSPMPFMPGLELRGARP